MSLMLMMFSVSVWPYIVSIGRRLTEHCRQLLTCESVVAETGIRAMLLSDHDDLPPFPALDK